jgi:hypothetical protein
MSTTAGTWQLLKVRTDCDGVLESRLASVKNGTADLDRAIQAIASRLNSSNTFVVVR